jgi:hypothetical protein
MYCDVESKWKNYHISTFPGQSLSINRGNVQDALKMEVQDRTLWRTQFGRGYGPVARRTTT